VRVGQLSTARFAESLLGRAMFGVLGLVGPRRALLRMNHNLAYNFNFVRCAFVERGPTEIEATLADVMGVSGYFAGIIQSGGERSGGKEVRVVPLEDDQRQARFRVTWAG
jgi:uncharacterized protein (TIGR02265 family)